MSTNPSVELLSEPLTASTPQRQNSQKTTFTSDLTLSTLERTTPIGNNLDQQQVDPCLPTMGAKLPGPHRRCSMRGLLTKILLFAVFMMIFMALFLKNDAIDVRGRILKAAPGVKPSVATQHPADIPVEPTPMSTHAIHCDIDTGNLRMLMDRYGLADKIHYLKRYVRFNRTPIQRKGYTLLEGQHFLPDKFKMVDVGKSYPPEKCQAPLEVPVTQSPYPATVNASDFMFAVSTTYGRFNASKTSPVNEWSHWLTNGNGTSNGGKLLLFLLDATDNNLKDVSDKLKGLGIDADVAHSDPSMEMAVRYLTLVPHLYNHSERMRRKWLVLCDDDTFFPSMHGLVEKFATFDPRDPLYIGTLSEDVNALHRHGSQAFGGAGAFLSVPLAGAINQLYESCRTEQKVKEADSGWGPQGDILLRKCIYEHTEVRLTNMWELWQLDLYGDPAGFYESGIKPLSLHHYKGGGWHSAKPFESSKVAHACGEDCPYQRFITADDFIISNGFSIAQYPQGLDFNLDQVERTFGPAPDDIGWNMDFVFGPQRRSLLRTGRKIAWELQEAHLQDDGSVVQVYTRRKDDERWVDETGEPMSKHDGIIELVWIPS